MNDETRRFHQKLAQHTPPDYDVTTAGRWYIETRRSTGTSGWLIPNFDANATTEPRSQSWYYHRDYDTFTFDFPDEVPQYIRERLRRIVARRVK